MASRQKTACIMILKGWTSTEKLPLWMSAPQTEYIRTALTQRTTVWTNAWPISWKKVPLASCSSTQKVRLLIPKNFSRASTLQLCLYSSCAMRNGQTNWWNVHWKLRWRLICLSVLVMAIMWLVTFTTTSVKRLCWVHITITLEWVVKTVCTKDLLPFTTVRMITVQERPCSWR